MTRSRALGAAAFAAALLLQAMAAPAGAADRPFHSPLEVEVLAELNRARTAPGEYAEHLRELRRSFRDRFSFVADGISFLTAEGVAAVDEAIAFLEHAVAVSALQGSRGLALAARDLVLDQALRGGTGHIGSDGSDPLRRMSRYGELLPPQLTPSPAKVSAGEIIGYGRKNARDIVVLLIVDDGVADRGHRLAIFNPGFRRAGVAFGPHLQYGWVCVIDLAGSFHDRRR